MRRPVVAPLSCGADSSCCRDPVRVLPVLVAIPIVIAVAVVMFLRLLVLASLRSSRRRRASRFARRVDAGSIWSVVAEVGVTPVRSSGALDAALPGALRKGDLAVRRIDAARRSGPRSRHRSPGRCAARSVRRRHNSSAPAAVPAALRRSRYDTCRQAAAGPAEHRRCRAPAPWRGWPPRASSSLRLLRSVYPLLQVIGLMITIYPGTPECRRTQLDENPKQR